METTEGRYAHLLQPIRELTKNWDIDVASELNDYLEELDEMCITFDGGRTRLNFAEAALLIQGSACIYSKKVELLHSLVYQTLEYINDKNKKCSKQTTESQEDGAVSGPEGDDLAAFTVVDLDTSEDSQRGDCSTTMKVAPLPPESLIPPESREKIKLPLISLKGETLCSVKDFRINIFIPEEDMILLTFGCAASRLVLDKRPAESLQTPADARATQTTDTVEENGSEAAEDFLPMNDNNMEVEAAEEHVDRQQAPSEGRLVRERQQVDEDKRRTEEKTPAVNVWALHDPYAILGEDRPFKSGKCYKVPDGLDDSGKRKRRRVASLQDFRSWFRGTYDPPEHKLKSGPVFTDLNYVYLSSMKNKLKTQRRIYGKAGVVVSDEELKRTFLQPEEAGLQQQVEEPVDGFRQPNLFGGDDDASDNGLEAFPDDVPADFGGPDFLSPENELSYEDLVKLRVEELVVNSRGYTQETALSQRVKDWEEAIRSELTRQEDSLPFDIHDYGDRVVSALSTVGQRRSFSSVVAGLDNFEACKYLLASLQLANDYTVEVDCDGGLDSMALILRSTNKATDRFKTLAAS